MPNINYNSGFGSDDQDLNDEESASTEAVTEEEDDSEEELEDELNEELEEDDDETEDDDDSELVSPIFSPTAANNDSSDDEALEDEDDELAESSFVSLSGTTEDKDDDEDESDLVEDEDLNDDTVDDDSVVISKAKIILVNKLLQNIRENTDRLSSILGGLADGGDEERIGIAEISDGLIEVEDEDGKIIEGVFNGENMIGPDGNEYAVPANYASKSKLVEGDMLKLTITDNGIFRYKQTKPVERKRVIGKLEKDSEGNYLVKADHKKFRVITASITYYKGIPGDKAVILIPVAGDSAWAAVENVIKSK